MILVFTSVYPKEEERPWYKRDILNVCCEPKGAQIQFAYRKVWIAENIQSADQLDGKEALIVYCERKNSLIKNQFSTGYFTFHPLREAIINNATDEFANTTISLQLGNFFAYETFDGNFPVDEFQEYITRSADNPNHPSRAGRFVRGEERWDKVVSCENWMPLVQYVGTLAGLDDSVFFCAQRKFGGPPIPLFPESKEEDSRTIYVLKSGLGYPLSFHLIAGSKASYKDPELTLTPGLGSVAGPLVRQRSAGLQVDYVVQCKRSFEEEIGMLSIVVPPLKPGIFRSPAFNVLVRLSIRRGFLILAVLLLTFGAFLVAMTPDTVKDSASLLGGSVGNWISIHKDSITWLSKFIGLVMMAVGSFVGFRKLPKGE